MQRPWYTCGLMLLGGLALLVAVFRPTVGAVSVAPGARLLRGPGSELRVLFVRPGSPLARAGLRPGDRFVRGESVEPERRAPRAPALVWTRGIPRSGEVLVRRDGRLLRLFVRPAEPVPTVRLAWGLLGLLNVGLVVLALALFWQRPRDGAAVLLGLVLLTAPVFSFPREGSLLALALAAHFFTIFPPSGEPPGRGRWRRAALYLPVAVLGLLAGALHDAGRERAATLVSNATGLGYALYGLLRVLARRRRAAPEELPLIRTLGVAAGAIVAAVAVGASQRLWVISDQFVPANLLPAAIFSGAVAHLVFRLRALEVRLMARRTLQYLLARWTLGTLFLIPGFLLVWRFGQLSVTREEGRPGEVLGYLLWMALAALLLHKRQSVLRRLDRRFFRDIDAARQALIQLAQDLGGQRDAEGVLSTLEEGIRRALRPQRLAFALPDAPPEPGTELSIPVRRGDKVLGCLHLGPRESGLPYTQEERRLLETAAVQAAVALENARLHAELLARQRHELAAQTAGVLAGAEEERRRLAADLHDQVLPELRQIAADVERLKLRANGATALSEVGSDLARLEQEIREAMDSVREVMEALRPSALDMLGVSDAVESYLRKGAARCDPPLAVTVRKTGEEPALTGAQKLGLYRICQEAINNLLKHSGARRAGLEVCGADGAFTLALWDDGCGFDPEACEGKGRGLGNIRYRAGLIGAEVRWSSAPGAGARLEVRLPVEAGGGRSAAGERNQER